MRVFQYIISERVLFDFFFSILLLLCAERHGHPHPWKGVNKKSIRAACPPFPDASSPVENVSIARYVVVTSQLPWSPHKWSKTRWGSSEFLSKCGQVGVSKRKSDLYSCEAIILPLPPWPRALPMCCPYGFSFFWVKERMRIFSLFFCLKFYKLIFMKY